MQNNNQASSRRNFLKHITASTIALGAGSLSSFAAHEKMEDRILQ
jgi:hypothetical protein